MSEELKPCPFCGIKRKIEVDEDDMFSVICMKCGAKTDSFLYDVDAIAAWNLRTPALAEENRKLVAALRETIVMCELTFGKDFRRAAADMPERLFEARKVLAEHKQPHLPLATNDDGWLCPNCLEQNVSGPPKKDDVLVCEHCSNTTLIE